MRSFLEFVSEATSASVQAKRLALKGDGHGSYYNRSTGEFEAKTENGELKFYNKRQVRGKDPAQTEFEKRIPLGSYQREEAEVPQEMPQEEPMSMAPPVPKKKGTLNIVFGRFNPPTAGHLLAMDVAAGALIEDPTSEYIIVPSRQQDKNKNPLDPDTKIQFMRRMFPQHSERIVNDTNLGTIFDVLKRAHNDGYSSVRIISGSNRVNEFEKLANNYNGQLYEFEGIEVLPSGEIDPDGKGMESVSASRLRLAAAEGDFLTFREGLGPGIKKRDAIELFYATRMGMGVEEMEENYNTWEIAPKFDQKTLRENYIKKSIFKVGDLVENLNTGLSGKIIRRGTNYLICVTEDDIMFKSWIRDVQEAYTEKHNDSLTREPGKPNTLVGTSGYLKYAMKMSPGCLVDKKILNNSRKK